MNNQRRKWISEISNKLAALKDELSNALDEEQEYFDNMPVSSKVVLMVKFHKWQSAQLIMLYVIWRML